MPSGRCYRHGGKVNPLQWRHWQPGLAAAAARNLAWRELFGVRWPGGRPVGWRKLKLGLGKRELVIAVAEEILERLPVPLSGGGDTDRMLEVWRLGIQHCLGIMQRYDPQEGIKRDRLVYEMTQGLGNQLVRIGEGLLQREKTDKLAGLLERLKEGEKRPKGGG